ncbi:endospore germination permease [Paenibacillus ginsengarvi]|uniref:Spore gernimation protein n=1 Tax=Paenibacillus ginsengarvi TaxID=400777 RepID=A0A3B0BSF7_9BACL|nr:endospore germination permease [Paenibacillus ginsengarvi]RKN74947.1 spore gernimation protein [Paenibacillus ginsengarvi]
MELDRLQSNAKISVLTMYMILMLSVGISNHVLLIPVLLETAKRDAWIGATASCIPVVIWMLLIRVIVSRTGNPFIFDWLSSKYGITVRYILLAIVLVYLLCAGFVSFADTVMWTKITYLPRTPKPAIALVLVLLCYFAARAGIRAIAIVSGLLLPGVVVLGYIVAIGNLQYKDYSLLTPLFTQGYMPALRALAYTSGGIFELILIVLLKHHVKSKIRLRGLLIMGFVAIGLTLGPLTGSIALFGPFEAAEQRYPAFEQWRMLTMGKFISHLDFFSIYQWIAGSFIRVSLMLFLAVDMLGIHNPNKRGYVLVGIAVLMLVAASLPFSDVTLLYALTKWYFPGISGLNTILGIVLLILSLLPAARRKGGEPG